MWLRKATALAVFFVFVCSAGASFVTLDRTAVLSTESRGVRAAYAFDQFALLAWVRPDTHGVICSIESPGDTLLRVSRNESGRAELVIHNKPTGSRSLAGGELPLGEWSLVVVSVDRVRGEVALYTRSQNGSRAGVGAPAMPPVPSTDLTFVLGATEPGRAMRGEYGLFTLRDHGVGAFDADALIESREYLGPYLMNNTPEGSMTGPDGSVWMIGHSLTASPINQLTEVVGSARRAAFPGAEQTPYNAQVYDREETLGRFLFCVRDVKDTEGFRLESPYRSGWFETVDPSYSIPLPASSYVRGNSPRLRAFLEGEGGNVRVLVSSNSRGAQRNDGSSDFTGNYANGFMLLFEDRLAGVLLRPATLIFQPWLAYTALSGTPWSRGEIVELDGTDYSRFFTGSARDGGGPGAGILLSQDAKAIFRSEEIGLMVAEEPLVNIAYLLAYPGSCDLNWRPNKHDRQGGVGKDIGAFRLKELDTTRDTHLFVTGAGDSIDGTTLVLDTPGVDAVVGDAVAHRRGIAVITEIAPGVPSPGTTTITLAHPWQTPPENGDTLAFGEWGIEIVGHEWDGLAPGDEQVWRGLRFEATNDGWPLALFSLGVWNPDADGVHIAPAGWGGHGYTPQLEQSNPGATQAWLRAVNPDILLQAPAQQRSLPSAMSDFLSVAREALPELEVAWIGETEHENGAAAEWHAYILNQGASEGVVGASLLRHARFGSILDQAAAGYRKDGQHYSGTGAIALAEEWRALLLRATTERPADLDGDGVVNSFDLAIVLSEWGQACAEACSADIDGDGIVGSGDLATLLAAWD